MGRGTIDCQEGRLSLLRGSWPPPPSAGFFLSSCHFSRPAACLVPSPAASASPGNLAEVPVLTPHPRPPEPETLGVDAATCVLTSLPVIPRHLSLRTTALDRPSSNFRVTHPYQTVHTSTQVPIVYLILQIIPMYYYYI